MFKEWHVYDAHDFAVERQSFFFNYRMTLERFNRRLGLRLYRTLMVTFYAAFLALASYIVVYFLSVNELLGNVVIPFDTSIIIGLGMLATLAILPILLPYVDSLNLPGISIKLRNNQTENSDNKR